MLRKLQCAKRFLTSLAFLLVAEPAFSHGPAQWIQDGNYKNAVGELCCGERDCGLLKSGSVKHVEGGYEVDADFEGQKDGETFVFHVNQFVPESKSTPSPTGDYWACAWGGELKCFFVPPPGS